MKILQVIPYFCFGGAETMCENLCYALQAMGHAVTVVSLYNERTPISERMEAAGIRILYLDKKLGLDISMVPKLLRIMKQERPDVVHTHLDVVKYAVAAARLAGIKKCVHTVHSLADKEAEGKIQKLINGFYFRCGWAKPVALSPEVQQTITNVYGIQLDVLPVIYNGIDLSRCTPKPDYQTGETFTLVHVGRFDAPKNHAGLLHAFQKLHQEYPQCRLCMVGDGELRPEMEILARELGILNYVQFCGMQSNVHPYLQEADVFILPSLYEGIPMTVIEAMGTALPIVATEVGGIPDLLKNGKTALLVPCDSDAVFEACAKLVRDQELRACLGQAAWMESKTYSAEHMARQYCEVYQAK